MDASDRDDRERGARAGDAGGAHLRAGVLVALADGVLPPAARAAAQDHVEACETCAAGLGDLLALETRMNDAALHAFRPEPDGGDAIPPALAVRLSAITRRALVHAAPERHGQAMPRAGRLRFFGSLAAAALLVVSFGRVGGVPAGGTVLRAVHARSTTDDRVLRGGVVPGLRFDLVLAQPADLVILQLTPAGRVAQVFPATDPLLGRYGLPRPLPAGRRVRVPPEPALDLELTAEARASSFFVVPDAPAAIAAEAAAAVLRLRADGVRNGELARGLEGWLQARCPGARVARVP